jgi:7,8-dihydroneopterin aldolase/epimerase/oxygenase
MDKLRISGLEVSARIGVRDWERQVRQRLLIDLELDIDAAAAARSDELTDALDYGAVARSTRDIAIGSNCRLIETLAELIADQVLEKYLVQHVTVVVHKPSAIPGARDTCVEIQRSR